MTSWELKVAIGRAFARLRKEHGLIARQAFLCCNSCAGYDIAMKFGAKTKMARAKIHGCVTYPRQSLHGLLETGTVWLTYGRIEHYGDDGKTPVCQTNLTTTQVGAIVVAALASEGVVARWDGKPQTRILAMTPDAAAKADAEDAVRAAAERDDATASVAP